MLCRVSWPMPSHWWHRWGLHSPGLAFLESSRGDMVSLFSSQGLCPCPLWLESPPPWSLSGWFLPLYSDHLIINISPDYWLLQSNDFYESLSCLFYWTRMRRMRLCLSCMLPTSPVPRVELGSLNNTWMRESTLREFWRSFPSSAHEGIKLQTEFQNMNQVKMRQWTEAVAGYRTSC